MTRLGIKQPLLKYDVESTGGKMKTRRAGHPRPRARVSENTARRGKHRMGESDRKSHEGLVSRTHKALLQLKTATQLKTGKRSRCFSKEDKQ